jgi:hypothetical protein
VSKLKSLGTPFYSLSVPQLAVMLLGFALSGLAYGRATRGMNRLETFTLSALALLLIYAVFPAGQGNTAIDVRWLLPATLLPFCASGVVTSRGRQALIWVPLVASVGHALVLVPHFARIERDLAAYDQVLSAVPRGGNLLHFVADSGRHGRPLVLRSHAQWYAIRSGGRVSWLFVAEGFSPQTRPNEHFAHFREPTRLYVPVERWKRADGFSIRRPAGGHWYDIIIENGWPEYSGVDRERIAREYDYVVVAGRDPSIRALVPAGVVLVKEVDGIAAFATGRAARRSP